MTALLPCPFHGQPNRHLVMRTMMFRQSRLHWVECEDCDACGPKEWSEEDAAEYWNRRAQPGREDA